MNAFSPRIESRRARALSARPSGFTLIELLVVIAVIAILAALIVPTAMGMVKGSRQTASAGQVKSLCAGLLAHMQDNGRYPMGYDKPAEMSWDKVIVPDNTGSLGLRAPLDTLLRTVGSPETRKTPNKWRSYSMVRNQQGTTLLGVAGAVYANAAVKESTPAARVDRPGETLLLVERFDPANIRFNDSGSVIDRPTDQTKFGAALTVQRGGKPTFVYGFCDGHAQILTPEETIGTGTMEKPLGMWTFETGD